MDEPKAVWGSDVWKALLRSRPELACLGNRVTKVQLTAEGMSPAKIAIEMCAEEQDVDALVDIFNKANLSVKGTPYMTTEA